MSPFQGNLKSRSDEQMDELKKSILEEGLLAPFFVWRGSVEGEDERNWLIDGHARHEALRLISEDSKDDGLWFSQNFPVVYIEAATVDDAKKALLQVTSSYGKITKWGAKKFCASIPEYRAPSVSAFLAPAARITDTAARISGKAASVDDAMAKPAGIGDGEVEITIAVPSRYKNDVLELFDSVSYVRVIRHG